MKKTSIIILFILIAVGLIWIGVWYNNKSSAQQTAATIAAQQAEASTTQSEILQIMANFKVKDDVVGTGAVAENGDTVTVNYTGKLDDGTVFDSSYSRNQPFSFVLGAAQVIQGWDLGVVGMKVGGTRELTIPPQLGYGAQANGPIPANSTLHFVIQLLSVSTSSASGTVGQ
jgi:FKBP-type peptidyl-prolyl cis-trans isomerase FkpA